MTRPRRYPVPGAPVRVEDRIEHSRFIATLARAETVSDAKAAIAAVRAEFPDATHHCFAYAIGPPGSTDAVASGDDGEPAGTAGRPMLGVVLNSGLGDVVVVVPYAAVDAVRRVVEREGGVVEAGTYGEEVALTLRLPEDRLEAVERAVQDATSGRARKW